MLPMVLYQCGWLHSWLAAVCLLTSVAEKGPIVTLHHEGQIQGLSTTFQNVPVDLFLGVRYAAAPVGVLRYEKPMPASWEGVVSAAGVGNFCVQPIRKEVGKLVGDEDCLFLYVTVPGGVQKGANKPVMVWIHGGGYVRGSGIGYIGAPLAVFNDVIVVSFNYRLGFLGFLSDKSANRVTGNAALWDQRAALVWVKKNIAQFGGDPELVTIFGESAGGCSVSALTMGRHSDGLFKRAIQQSGSLFLPWSWDTSHDATKDITLKRLQEDHCKDSTPQTSMLECLRHIPVESIYSSIDINGILNSPFKPTEDDDFFQADISDYTFKLSQRFDLLSGMNEHEGLIAYIFDVTAFAAVHNVSIENGMSKQFTNQYLLHICTTNLAKLSPLDCVRQVMHLYKIDEVTNDSDRARRVINFLGDYNFRHDILYGLDEHSYSTKSTYAYYFTELVPSVWDLPKWGAKAMAGHAEEMSFIFGIPFLKDEPSQIWADILHGDKTMPKLFHNLRESSKNLSRTMMLMWSNFAKSGNPNEPIALPAGTPTWPQFNTEANHWIELNSNGIHVRTTPDRDRLVKLRQLLYADKELQHQLGKHSADGDTLTQTASVHKEL